MNTTISAVTTTAVHAFPTLAFFDLDCTLSEPIYRLDDGSFTSGFHHTDWIEYCHDHTLNAYEYCKPVPIISQYASSLKSSHSTELFVLGAFNDPIELPSKREFISMYYSDLFDEDHIIFVKYYRRTKVEKIKEIASSLNVPLSSCELIEDDYTAVLDAISAGIKGTHVTKIFNDYYFNSSKK